ncbi:MAG: HD domain-containing protein [Asgard group archaeon]|nr:HD domain-containing protein [Asgard group archaeon]
MPNIDKNLTGVILSGGYSNRFQLSKEPWLDKALYKITKDTTILEKTVLTLSSICPNIIIMTNNLDRILSYETIIEKLPTTPKKSVILEKDNQDYYAMGPTLGILSAINHSETSLMIFTPVDIPNLNVSIFEQLIESLNKYAIVVPFWLSTGKIEPLVFGLNTKKLLAVDQVLSKLHRNRADDIHRAVKDIAFMPVVDEFEELANKLLSSLNERKKLNELKLKDDMVHFKLFNNEQVIIHSSDLTNKDITKIVDFLQKGKLIKPSEEHIKQLIDLVNELRNKELYFYSAVLLEDLLSNMQLSDKNRELYDKIQALCFDSFIQESKAWRQLGIHFLELHCITDALSLGKILTEEESGIFQNRVQELKNQMILTKKPLKKDDFESLMKDKLPNFLNNAKTLIQEAEKEFNKKESKYETDFLWDHSFRVSKIAFKIAVDEGIDPFIPGIAAMMHDSGKFILGKYRIDELPEEEHSATAAEKLLKEEGLSIKEIIEVKNAINALYNDKFECNINCKIVHDADRLDKLGTLGIANFFSKMTLRGVNLQTALIKHLSKELTYAQAAPKNMMTKTGRKLAVLRSKQTIDYFRNLLDEYQFYNLGKFFIRKIIHNDVYELLLLVPEKCDFCQGSYVINLSQESGIKCEQVKVNYNCTKCNNTFTISFCLPILYDLK